MGAPPPAFDDWRPAPVGTGAGYCRTGPSSDGLSESGASSGTLGRLAARRLVLDLADRLRGAAERPPPRPPVGGDEAEQEDDRLAGDEQQHDHGEEEGTLSQSASPRRR